MSYKTRAKLSAKSSVVKSSSIYSSSLTAYQNEPVEILSTCDVFLIVSNGFQIPVHAFILQMVSTWFEAMLQAQREAFYFGPRIILLPDYEEAEICNLIQFIYTGEVNFSNKAEVDDFKGLLEEFKICVDLKVLKKWTQAPSKLTQEPVPKIRVIKKLKVPTIAFITTPKNYDTNRSNHSEKRRMAKLEEESEINDAPSSSTTKKPKVNLEDYKETANVCQICRKIYERPHKALQCLKRHGFSRCPICFTLYPKDNHVYEHLIEAHGDTDEDCDFCDERIAGRFVSGHMWGHYASFNLDETEKESTTNVTNEDPTKLECKVSLKDDNNIGKKSDSTSNDPKTENKMVAQQSASHASRDPKRNGRKCYEENGQLKVPDLDERIIQEGILGIKKLYIIRQERPTD